MYVLLDWSRGYDFETTFIDENEAIQYARSLDHKAWFLFLNISGYNSHVFREGNTENPDADLWTALTR